MNSSNFPNWIWTDLKFDYFLLFEVEKKLINIVGKLVTKVSLLFDDLHILYLALLHFVQPKVSSERKNQNFCELLIMFIESDYIRFRVMIGRPSVSIWLCTSLIWYFGMNLFYMASLICTSKWFYMTSLIWYIGISLFSLFYFNSFLYNKLRNYWVLSWCMKKILGIYHFEMVMTKGWLISCHYVARWMIRYAYTHVPQHTNAHFYKFFLRFWA